MNRLLIDEAKILIDSAYVALDRVKAPDDIDTIRQLVKEADELLGTRIAVGVCPAAAAWGMIMPNYVA